MSEITTKMPLLLHPFQHKIAPKTFTLSHSYTSHTQTKKKKRTIIVHLCFLLVAISLPLSAISLLPSSFTNSPFSVPYLFSLFLIIVYFEIMSRSIKIQEKVNELWLLFFYGGLLHQQELYLSKNCELI